jgi:molybdopterin-guanine dinucleotide biosynthesis protein A
VAPPDDAPSLAAVVLAGGTAKRMHGADKASLLVEGVTLLEHALAATASAAEVVVVGAPVPTTRPVAWALEDPPSGGPAAGLLAGVDRLGSAPALVAVLAVDMPRVLASTVGRLVAAVAADPDADGALLVDGDGRRQPLAAVYRCAALERVRPPRGHEHGLPMRRLVTPLRLVEVPAVRDEACDVDTWNDLQNLDG